MPGALGRGNEPSSVLRDRLDTALSLYEAGVAPKILVSGDHGQDDYDEVNVMRDYLLGRGVPAQDIFMDHAGFNTWNTMIRARNIFGVDTCVVVTNKYHLYRAVYLGRRLGLEPTALLPRGMCRPKSCCISSAKRRPAARIHIGRIYPARSSLRRGTHPHQRGRTGHRGRKS